MKKVKVIIVALLFLAVLPIFVSAEKITLLAVSQADGKLVGSVADLELDVRPGSGRVFLETYPLSKLDTQISTRFAKSIACNHIELDCNNYDFFYSIKSDSVIVGGPSAGSSITLLTIFKLQNMAYDQNVALTGTINSGGLIGPVSGLKEKIEAAKKAGIKKVLIPKGEIIAEDLSDVTFNEAGDIVIKTNGTGQAGNLTGNSAGNITKINLAEYGNKLGIEVVEVSDVDDAIYEFTGKRVSQEEVNLELDESYVKTMKELAGILCNRSDVLKTGIDKNNIMYSSEPYKSLLNSTNYLYQRSNEVYSRGDYYSAASYCFGANSNYRFMATIEANYTADQIVVKSQEAIREIDNVSKKLDERKLNTLTDLQTYMIVKERLDEARKNLAEAITSSTVDSTGATRKMTYGIERLYSAYSWSHFFNNPGKEIKIDDNTLKVSCIEKIYEAEERRQYIKLMVPVNLGEFTEINDAYFEMNHSNYKMCLFKASKAKAEADIVLTVIGVEDSQLKEVIQRKQEIVGKLISKQQKKAFPILGYSYHEYSKSLINDDPYASLLYSEYALELSNLDLYFTSTESKSAIQIPDVKKSIVVSYSWLLVFALVVFMAGFFMFYFSIHKKHIKHHHDGKRIMKKK